MAALSRVASIIVGIAGGQVAGDAIDIVGAGPVTAELTLRASRVKQVLGEAVPLTEARTFLEAAGFEISSASATELKVRAPSWRADITGEIDLVEEVARFHGYDKFPSDIRPFRPSNTVDDPQWALPIRPSEEQRKMMFRENARAVWGV